MNPGLLAGGRKALATRSSLDYDLIESGQAAVGMLFRAGPVTYCGAFVSPDEPPSRFDNATIFRVSGKAARQSALAPPGCWIVDQGSPSGAFLDVTTDVLD